MQCGYLNSFLVFLRQHQEMKTAILDIQRMLECFGSKNIRLLSENLINKLEDVTKLTINHIAREEKEIMPILHEMYDPEVEIAQYIKDEHGYIIKELHDLVGCLQTCRTMDIEINEYLLFRIHAIFEEILVHFFEEEQGLFPLLQGYLKAN